MTLRSLLLASLAALTVPVAAHANTLGLEGSIGATPTFSVTSNGLTATYSSPAGNGFQVQDTTGLFTFNTALVDNNFFGTDPLTVSFSSLISGRLSIPFSILDSYGTGDTLLLTTNTGQSMTFAATPDGLALGEPEGLASLVLNGPIQSFSLTSSNAFAIGDISTAASQTPEPGSLVLMATGLAGIVLLRRRTWSFKG